MKKYMWIILVTTLFMPLNVMAAEINFCVETSPIWQFIGYVLFLIKIVIPLLIIIFGIVDLVKAVISSDDKAINKSVMSVVQRVIAGVIIFFIPTIVSFVFSLVKEATPFLTSADACQKCMLNPTGADCKGYKTGNNVTGDSED